MTQIRNYPFARVTLERRVIVPEERESCDWCGSRPGKFAYSINDGWRDHDIAGCFCSVSCMRAYHDLSEDGEL